MKAYFVKTSRIISDMLFPSLHWKVNTSRKEIFITFDDGPTPEVTEKVLKILDQYQAKATFFLIADKVKRFPELTQELISKGHAIGNHTYHHLNGWKQNNTIYFQDIEEASQLIDSKLFRPPYGKIYRTQITHLKKKYYIIMWSVLSGDFDTNLTPQNCYENISGKADPGSIVVFHDSEKAAPRMLHALPKFLEEYSRQGYIFPKITPKILSSD